MALLQLGAALGYKGCGLSSSLTADDHTFTELAFGTADWTAETQHEAHFALEVVPFGCEFVVFTLFFRTLRRE